MITPLSPLDLPGCVLYVTPDMLQLGTSGTPAGSSLIDVTGQVTLTQATSANQPTVTFPKLAGRSALSWNGTSQYYDLGNATSGPLYNLQSGSYSFAFAFNSGTSSSYSTLLAKNGGAGRMFFLINGLAFSRWNGLTSTVLQPNTPYVAVYVYQYLTATTGNEYLYLNGQLAASNLNVTVTNDTSTSFKIGQTNNQYWLTQDVYAICGWNRAITNSEMLSVSNYLLKQMGFLVNLILDGNSIVAGTGASTTSLGHAPILAQMLRASTYTNLGQGGSRFFNGGVGSTITGLGTRLKPYPGWASAAPYTNVQQLIAPAADWNFLIAWEATNAFWRDGVSVQQNINDTLAYFAQARALGGNLKLATCTAPYMQLGTGGATEAKRQQYNTWMRANYTSFADFLIDYGGDRLLNQIDRDGTGNYNPYFSGGASPHPNNLGHARMAQIAVRDTQAYMSRMNANRAK